jgi:8-amino-7-oxononanoate synthase
LHLFDALREAAATRTAFADLGGPTPFGVPFDEVLSATQARAGGRPVILLGSNNYLGFTHDAACIEAGVAAARAHGTGTTGSRMANGSWGEHRALEAELAAFFGTPAAVVFSTGYQANLGVLAALRGPGDVVVIDADSHASIYDGCRLSGAQVLRFRHNDAGDLDTRLRRLGEAAARALVVVEGVYSMLGDRAPLGALVEVTRRHGAALMVDEAHGVGVLGAGGRGAAEAEGVLDGVDVVVGTFSKSLGTIGGFAVSRHAELELVRYASRPYIFTAAPAPATVASTRAALAALQRRPELREALWRNARRLYDGLRGLGFVPLAQVGPVIAVPCPGRVEALRAWQALWESGVYVNLMVPPATPGGQHLLRASVSAAHTPAQLDAALAAFAGVAQAAGLAA